MGCLGDDPPDPAKGYVAGINADLETLPSRKLLEKMAQLGESGYVDIPGKGPQWFDFTGLGEADYQAQYGDQMTAQLLQLQKEMGPEFVAQRLKELELSDPEGAAMRRNLWAAIQQGVTDGPTARPEAEALQAQILADLERGATLDDATKSKISQGVLGGQVSRGNWLGNAAATEEATAMTAAGEQQQTDAQQRALTFLTTGVSPQDAAYREESQNLNNLGAFLSGESPTAQFGQLSGAAGGAVPFSAPDSNVGVNPNAGWEGVQNQANIYGINQQARANTVNPWVAGLSGALQGMNLWAGLGGQFGGGGAAAGAGAGAVQGGWNSGWGSQWAGMT